MGKSQFPLPEEYGAHVPGDVCALRMLLAATAETATAAGSRVLIRDSGTAAGPLLRFPAYAAPGQESAKRTKDCNPLHPGPAFRGKKVFLIERLF